VFLHLGQPEHQTLVVLRHDKAIPLAPLSYQRTPWRCCHAVLYWSLAENGRGSSV
jgi:hypothetical protein